MWINRLRQPATGFAASSSRLARAPRPAIPAWRRYASTHQEAPRNTGAPWTKIAIAFVGTGAVGFGAYNYVAADSGGVEGKITNSVSRFTEDPALFVQEKRSLKSPGVYLWGANTHRVVDPSSKETVVKGPRGLSYFEGQVLRDLKLDEKSGAAINEKGDLVQWGKGFSEANFLPTQTLVGKNLSSLCMSNDRILALASDGKVYSLPISKEDQQSGNKPKEGSWIPFKSGNAGVNYRTLQPNLGMTEKVISISGGQDHALLLTNSGRVFSVASSTENYPSFGQLGIPGLTWSTRPKGPVDTCHEVTALKGSKITQIATGDYHSLALSKDGEVFAFGDNSLGQLGVEYDFNSPFIDAPVSVPLRKLYRKKEWNTKITQIAAGGANSFFAVDAQRIGTASDDPTTIQELGRITADVWTSGRGIWGLLGNGRWTHMQDVPTKVKTLCGLFEFDDHKKAIIPIRLREMSVGTTHASAVLNNNAHIHSTAPKTLDAPEDWGYDAVWWGGNEQFQLGTGKRSNASRPTHISIPLTPEKKGEKAEARLQIMPRHKGQVEKRTVSMEQRVECGRHVSGIYSST